MLFAVLVSAFRRLLPVPVPIGLQAMLLAVLPGGFLRLLTMLIPLDPQAIFLVILVEPFSMLRPCLKSVRTPPSSRPASLFAVLVGGFRPLLPVLVPKRRQTVHLAVLVGAFPSLLPVLEPKGLRTVLLAVLVVPQRTYSSTLYLLRPSRINLPPTIPHWDNG